MAEAMGRPNFKSRARWSGTRAELSTKAWAGLPVLLPPVLLPVDFSWMKRPWFHQVWLAHPRVELSHARSSLCRRQLLTNGSVRSIGRNGRDEEERGSGEGATAENNQLSSVGYRTRLPEHHYRPDQSPVPQTTPTSSNTCRIRRLDVRRI